jgi:ribosome biogenesis ATPase
VRKLVDEQNRFEPNSPRLAAHTVYDKIKGSNSSLGRKSRSLLESSIDRVIAVIDKEDEDEESGSIDGDFDGMEEAEADLPESNVMNKNIVKSWRGKKATDPVPPRVRTPPSQSSRNERQSSRPVENAAVDLPTAPPKKREGATTGDLARKRRKGERKELVRSPAANITLADLGGVDSVIHDLTELVALPMLYPEIYTSSGIQPTRGVLLHGPPGCGKTMMANAFAAELGVSFIPISAPSIVSGMSGESEKKLREYFDEARKMAPCLMFIDEIDAITPKRESAQREMEKRIVAQMLTCLDDLALEKTDGKPVIIIAATNRPDSLDPALRRAGRFNKEINLSVPDEGAREKILYALTRHLRLSADVDFQILAKQTPGFVGADLSDLVSTAGVTATKRVFEILSRPSPPPSEDRSLPEDPALPPDAMDISTSSPSTPNVSSSLGTLQSLIRHATNPLPNTLLTTLTLTLSDFTTALPKIQPSSKREGFATIPNTTWADIGALHTIREELTMAIVEPIARPERYAAVGITAPTGVLLWGPPGCGKTLLAKAVANESRANFISVKGPELLNKYVGESERAVRQVFVRARSSIPCVIFFDELDALVPKREDSLSEASSRVVNTLLTELDGLGDRAGIYVIAATNRPDRIDAAMLRPGRLGTLLFVDLPGPEERVEILRTLVKIPTDTDLDSIARQCDGFSGADLESLLRAAGVAALKRGGMRVQQVDFETAMGKVEKSVVDGDKYRRLRGRREWG